MMDMSKAFDTVAQNTIMQDLKTVLQQDELNLITILVKDVQLAVKLNGKIGQPFTSHHFTDPLHTSLYSCTFTRPPILRSESCA